MEYHALLEPLKKIALDAGKAILQIYENETDFGIESKADHSPLTRADKASNEVICEGLAAISPDIPIISEENKQVAYDERKNYAYFWLVDPLDGTKEFIKRNGEFTVNIALVEGNRVVMGIVYTPVTNELAWATKGKGAWKEENGQPTQMDASSFRMTDTGLKIVCSRSHLNTDTQAFIDKLNEPEKVSKGSSLKFMLLANGEADIYPRLGPTMEWDTGAAQIILEEAGGKVLLADSEAPLLYNKESLLNPYFIASGRVLEAES